MGHGDGDGSGACAHVDDAEWSIVCKACQHCFDEEFGLGAGNQNAFGDVDGEAVKLLGSGDVLDGLEAQAALDEALDGGLLVAVEWALGVGDEGGAVDLEQVHEEERRVGNSGGAQVGVGRELAGGAG